MTQAPELYTTGGQRRAVDDRDTPHPVSKACETVPILGDWSGGDMKLVQAAKSAKRSCVDVGGRNIKMLATGQKSRAKNALFRPDSGKMVRVFKE